MKGLARQLSSGLILGLSAVIYAISYAALMFSGALSPYLAYGLTVALITAAAGGLYGLFAEESTFVSGPDSNTSSVLAGMMAALAATPMPGTPPLHAALAVLMAASVSTALTFLLIERFGVARLVRFVPFQVMAGFLASTGWLMSSGALNIIAGTPLSLDTVLALAEQPWRPELVVGIALMLALGRLNRRFGAAVAIPGFVIGVSVVVNLAVRLGCPRVPSCHPDRWFFQPFQRLEWLAPWQLQVDSGAWLEIARLAPSFLAVAFVATLTVLLSLSSLELAYQRDFRLEPALRLHGRMNLLTAAIGGYVGLISIGRSTMCRQTGGGRLSSGVIAAVCIAVLLGLGWLLAWIPKVALGALVLYLGVGMLRQWLWDLRKELAGTDLLQVVSILMCVIAFGYVVGFLAGLLAACIFFVVNYARMPHVRLDTTLASVRSSVIRDVADQQYLTAAGSACRIGRFEGFVFFGVANSIYEWYRAADPRQYPLLVLDFSKARGIDPSAVAVLQKIIRNEAACAHQLILAVGDNELALSPAIGTLAMPVFAGTFDAALELAEEHLLGIRDKAVAPRVGSAVAALDFFESPRDRDDFTAYLGELQLKAGESLFQEGQASDEIFFVERGRLEILKAGVHNTRIRLAKIVAGSMIGEMALYSGRPRTASVSAVEPVTLRVLSRIDWLRMKEERPDLAARLDHHVILSLANTVGRANAALSLAG